MWVSPGRDLGVRMANGEIGAAAGGREVDILLQRGLPVGILPVED